MPAFADGLKELDGVLGFHSKSKRK